MQKDDMTYDRAAIDALCNVGEHNSLSVEEIRKSLTAELEQKNVESDELTADSMSRLYSNGFFDGYKQARKDMSQTSESAQWVQLHINPNLYKCSNCQVAWNKRLVFDNEGYGKNIFMKYCPCCGRKMKTKVDYE